MAWTTVHTCCEAAYQSPQAPHNWLMCDGLYVDMRIRLKLACKFTSFFFFSPSLSFQSLDHTYVISVSLHSPLGIFANSQKFVRFTILNRFAKNWILLPVFSIAAQFRCVCKSLFALIHFVCFRKLRQNNLTLHFNSCSCLCVRIFTRFYYAVKLSFDRKSSRNECDCSMCNVCSWEFNRI